MRGVFFVATLGLVMGALLSVVSSGCSSPKRAGSKSVSYGVGQTEEGSPGNITQFELQQDLQRFQNRFMESLRDGSRELEDSPEGSKDPTLRRNALAQRLKYSSSSLAIALGPNPEVNLLDMVAFIEICRKVYKDYWIPQVFGKKGQGIERAFDRSAEDIWLISGRVLNHHQQEILRQVIQKWQEANPNQIAIEAVRLFEFGKKFEDTETAEEASGLFASVEAATQRVDEMKLFAERALYYGEILPFLVRLQAELGVEEISGRLMGQAERLIDEAELPLNRSADTKALLGATTVLVGRTHEMLTSMQKLFDQASTHPDVLTASTKMVTELSTLSERLLEFDQSAPSKSRLAGIAGGMNTEASLLSSHLLSVGLILITAAFIAFVVGSVVARLLGAYLTQRFFTQNIKKSDGAS